MTDRDAIQQLQGMIEFDVYSLYEVEALTRAISALQEREGRNKGCEACLHGEDQTYQCYRCARYPHADLYLSDHGNRRAK